MAKKFINSDFEDIKEENDEFEFDEEDFGDIEDSDIKRGRKRKKNGHAIFFAFVIVVLIGCGISLFIWNKGQDIDAGVEIDESEFDTEPNDYIQPMTTEQLAGKPEDGVNTIVLQKPIFRH